MWGAGIAGFILLLSASPLHAQDSSPLAKTLRDPLLWLNIGGQGLAGATTTRFLTGHGQSVDHVGPCVEGNARWGTQPSLMTVWSSRAVLMGASAALLYWGHHYDNHASKTGKAIRAATALSAFASGSIAVADGAHNLLHCGW